MAFTPTNYNYVRVMAGLKGRPMATFLDEIITAHRLAHEDIYAEAQALAERLRDD